MSNLQEVVRYVRSALDHHSVFVHMTAPQLETLLAGLGELQKENERLNVASNDGVTKFTCPSCLIPSTSNEWDIHTAMAYKGEPVNGILEDGAYTSWFTCPSCSKENSYDHIKDVSI